MPTALVNGTRIYWELTGTSGDPLVLVHGSWGDHHSWDRVVPGLARSFRVLTFDRRGHSQSERPVAQGSVHQDVADLGSLIEHLGLSPAHILGNSFGGSIVLRLASEKPDLFKSVLVHEPPLFGLVVDPVALKAIQASNERVGEVIELLERGETEAAARHFMETVALGPGAWQQLPELLRQTIQFNAPTFLDEQRDPVRFTLDVPSLTMFSHPALLTQGDQGAPFFPPVLDVLERILPRSKRQSLPQVGHVPHLSHPNEYVEVVTSFIRTVSPSAN